jgi:hypothetical protein
MDAEKLLADLAPGANFNTYTQPVTPIYCDCGCLFIPQISGAEFYPDRFEMGGGCDTTDCPCHDIAKTVGLTIDDPPRGEP